VILAYGSGKRHSDEIGGKDRFAVGPVGECPHSKEAKKQKLCLDLGKPASIPLEEARGEPRKNEQDHGGNPEGY
jgi:hypothetical protein